MEGCCGIIVESEFGVATFDDSVNRAGPRALLAGGSEDDDELEGGLLTTAAIIVW